MPTVPKTEVHEGGLASEGWHRCRVSDCQAKTSRNNEGYYNIALETPEGQFLGYDVAMLEGRGNGIGIKKLLALGACQDIGDAYEYDPAHAITGKQGYVYLKHEEYDGKTQCKVDISQGRCGYLPLSSPPAEASPGNAYPPPEYDGVPAGADDDDIPF